MFSSNHYLLDNRDDNTEEVSDILKCICELIHVTNRIGKKQLSGLSTGLTICSGNM